MNPRRQFPFVKSFADYHEILDTQIDLREYFGDNTIKAKEVAFDGRYWALIYFNKLPPRESIERLLAKKSFASDLEYAEIYR